MEFPRIPSLSHNKEKQNETKNNNFNSKKITPTLRYVSPYFNNRTDNNNNNNIVVLPKRNNNNENETETSATIRYVSPYFDNHTQNNNVVVLPKRNANVIVPPKRKKNVLPKRNTNVVVPPKRKKNENEMGTSSSAVRYVSPYFKNSTNKNVIVVSKKTDKKRKTLSSSEKFKEAYKRRAPDNTWEPPKSPHNLLQEEHAHDPWRVLVICMLLNVTTGRQVKSVLSSLFNLCPNAKYCIQVPMKDIEHVIMNLGLQKKRAKMLKHLSEEYLDESWTHVTQLHGVGKYAADAYAIFCTGKWDEVTPSDTFLNIYWDWLRSREHT